jgi:hypothetical protein
MKTACSAKTTSAPPAISVRRVSNVLAWALALCVGTAGVAEAGLHRIHASTATWDDALATAVFTFDLSELEATEVLVSAALEVGVIPGTAAEDRLPVARIVVAGGTRSAPSVGEEAEALASSSAGEEVPLAWRARVALDLTGTLVAQLTGGAASVWVAAQPQGGEYTPVSLAVGATGLGSADFLVYTRRTEAPGEAGPFSRTLGLQRAPRAGVAVVAGHGNAPAASKESGASDRTAASPGRGLTFHPNPLAAGSALRFALQREDHVVLEVFDLSGRRVAIQELGLLGAGEHQVPWAGRDAAGSPVARGVYFARLKGTGWAVDQKITVLR